MRKLKTIHAGLTTQIERGGIAGATATSSGGFGKKPRGPSSKPAARRPSTGGKRPSVDPHTQTKDPHNISGFSSSAFATAGGFSTSGVKEYTP